MGHTIFKNSDKLSMLKNGLFQHCLHRISLLPDQCMQTRYSLEHLQRVEAHTTLSRPENGIIPKATKQAQSLGSWQVVVDSSSENPICSVKRQISIKED